MVSADPDDWWWTTRNGCTRLTTLGRRVLVAAATGDLTFPPLAKSLARRHNRSLTEAEEADRLAKILARYVGDAQ